MDVLNTEQVQINEITISETATKTTFDLLNQRLLHLVSHITPELCSDSESDSDTDPEEEEDKPEGHCLYGGALLRDVEQSEKDLTLNYTSGTKFTDITKHIQKIKWRKYKDITMTMKNAKHLH